jgi:MFS family permease
VATTTEEVRRFTSGHPHYRWIVLTNTTIGMLMVTVSSSIVLISMPAIFRGIRLNPLDASNVGYLLWLLMGFLLVSAVLVVTFGRLGDMRGRVRTYNAGFIIFAITSIVLSLDPWYGRAGALWLIGWRVVQAVGGAMIMANSTAIITDAFPPNRRGMALGINQVAAIAGSFLGLIVGGVLADWHWRAIFWVSVPVAVVGAVWSIVSLHDTGIRHPAKLDSPGNLTVALGLGLILTGVTYGIQPYGKSAMGWTSPTVVTELAAGVLFLLLFGVVESRTTHPMFHLDLFRIRAFAFGNLAGLLASIARGGLQFMLIIWLQGIWLPLHGYSYVRTPLWSSIFLLPLSVGFLLAGPLSGFLSDRLGARHFAAAGAIVSACAFIGLALLPVNFPYWGFATLTLFNGIGSGMFAAPNATMIMNSVPAAQRGAASGMRLTFFNSGSSLSIGVFFSLMVVGLSATVPATLLHGLTAQGVPIAVASHMSALPPVGLLFAAFLGINPIGALLGPTGLLATLSSDHVAALTGNSFFPNLISAPFSGGLHLVFGGAAAMMFLAAASSWIGGKPEEIHVSAPAVGERTGEEPDEFVLGG